MCPGIKIISNYLSQHDIDVPNNRGGGCLLCDFLETSFIYCCRYFRKDRIIFVASFCAEDFMASLSMVKININVGQATTIFLPIPVNDPL